MSSTSRSAKPGKPNWASGSLAIDGYDGLGASGHVKSMTYGNGRTVTAELDDRGRAISVTSPDVMGLGYAYDGADNVVSYYDSRGGSPFGEAATQSARTMDYDRLDRLIVSIAPHQWGTAVYDYDELGNRRFMSVGSDPPADYAYDAKNRLQSVSMTNARPTMTFGWDLAGRLASSSDGVGYRYEGRGRRVMKLAPAPEGTTVYHYDAAGRVLAETTAAGEKLRAFIYLGNTLLAVDGCIDGSPPGCTERQWYHTDALGSLVAKTDRSGAVVARLDYEPFGKQWNPAGSLGDRQYNGRVFDQGTGFHDYGARLYWPEIGRFVSADSVMGEPGNPMTLNRYSYVLDNPYRYLDPRGCEPQDVAEMLRQESEKPMYTPGPLQRGADTATAWYSEQSLDPDNSPMVRAAATVVGAIVGLFDSENFPTTLALATMAPRGGGTVTRGGPRPLAEQAADLVPVNGGRSRVTLSSPSRRVEVDLTGKPHAGVPTPHTKVSARNTQAPEAVQPAYNTKQAETKPATQQDIRMVRRALERR